MPGRCRSPAGRAVRRRRRRSRIEEYARHNGHTDLLREHIDGAIGP
ncbi:DUF664 domain-containing protein [Streptomyces collinus]